MAGTQRGGARGVKVRIIRLAHNADLPLPAYQTAGAAGVDLVAAVAATAPVRLKEGQRALVPTGLMIELPSGYEAQIRPRSGLALKHGITVLNSPGTIDSDYRGEVQVLLINLGDAPFVINRGERIAQMVIAPVSRVTLAEAKTARATQRGAGGFGSTGLATATAKSAAAKSASAKTSSTKSSSMKSSSMKSSSAKTGTTPKKAPQRGKSAKTKASKSAGQARAAKPAQRSYPRRALATRRRR